MVRTSSIFNKLVGWSGGDLIQNAKILGYEVSRINGDHYIMRHPQLSRNVVIPLRDDLRRTDVGIVKQLRKAELTLRAQADLKPLLDIQLNTRSATNKVVPNPTQLEIVSNHPMEEAMASPKLAQSWNLWLREVRQATGLSLKAISELFQNPLLSEALLSQVELGKRHFSKEEFKVWCEIFNIKQVHYPIPLATDNEMQRRELWHTNRAKAVKKMAKTPTPAKEVATPAKEVATPVTQPTVWNAWVREQRIKSGLTLRIVLDRMGLEESPASVLHDTERGRRRFRKQEFTAWLKVLGNPQPPVQIPLSTRPSKKRTIVTPPALMVAHVAQEPMVVPVQALADPSRREALLAKVQKVVNNTHLTDDQVAKLVATLRSEALTLLGF